MLGLKSAGKGLIGVDITSATVKLLELSRQGNRYQIDSYAVRPLKEGAVVERRIRDMDEVVLAIKRAVERHAGLAVLPDYAVAEETPLVRVMDGLTMPSFDTYFAYSSELRNSARLNAFREFLLAEAAEWDF